MFQKTSGSFLIISGIFFIVSDEFKSFERALGSH